MPRSSNRSSDDGSSRSRSPAKLHKRLWEQSRKQIETLAADNAKLQAEAKRREKSRERIKRVKLEVLKNVLMRAIDAERKKVEDMKETMNEVAQMMLKNPSRPMKS